MLQSLADATETATRAREKHAEQRLTRAWPLIVGPALVNHTRLLRVRHHTLVLGCWKPELVPSLRKSVEAVWPDLRQRILKLTRIDLHKLEVLPCDPPAPPAPDPARPADPLDAVLTKLRTLRNQGWTPRRS